ncbi:unnamed protein product [Dibothriocephalus latus]|uniref:Uncharacterized protein n=1 Tax=Dibothriocephalus latus TaxID=60516 RepID=A0A3P6U7H2_DIBLA|nr:unnamed protein product [Dibothriocephalus latus]
MAQTEDRSCDAIEREKGFEVFTQSDAVHKLTTSQAQSDIVQPVPKPALVSTQSQCISKQTNALGIQIESEAPPVEIVAEKAAPVVHSAPRVAQTEDRCCDAIERVKGTDMFTQSDPVRIPVMVDDCVSALPLETKPASFGKNLQVNLAELEATQSQTQVCRMGAAVTSGIVPRVAPVRLDSSLVQSSVSRVIAPVLADSASQSLQPSLSSLGVQIEASKEPVPVIAPVAAPVVKSAPPMPAAATEDRACDAISGPQCADAFAQSTPTVTPLKSSISQSESITRPTYVYLTAQCVNIGTYDFNETANTLNLPADFLTFGKTQTATPLLSTSCQTRPKPMPAPMLSTTKTQCISKQMNAHGIQVESEPPPVEVVANKAAPVVHSAPPVVPRNDMWVQAELPAKRPPCRGVRIQAGLPAAAPKVQVQKRDGYVQSTPVVMVGTTQTYEQEETPLITVVAQPKVETAPPAKPIPDDNIFSFTRETVARVTRSSSRKSSGLIPYKTQVFSSPKQMSSSMPAQLNVRVDGGNTITSTTEQITYQQAPIASNLPRRYVTRLRSPSARNFYTRRNRSAEHVDGYDTYVNRGMCRNFVSDHELYTGNTCEHCSPHAGFQQFGVEQRCTATLEAYVRQLGYETVHRTLVEVAQALELEEWTPLAPGEQISIVYQSELSAAEANFFCFGEEGADSSGKQVVGLVRKAEPLTMYQPGAVRPIQEMSSEEFLKSRALSAYCSDAELQESGIKTNYSAYDAFTLVSWQANDRGDGRLELSTLGRLLKLTLVGARLPSSGEIIAAADAFYRGVLRIVYFDEESSTMLTLPAAINTGHVIVEKQYPPGLGIALRGDQDRYPVQSEVVWNTPELRHRSYKVNYIRKSENEKIDVLTALDEGVIDQYSGEIVNVTLSPSISMGEPIHEARESSVGSGDTVLRRQKPERFTINEAILNDILNVEFDGQETSVRVDLTAECTEDSNGSKSGSGEPSEVDI